MSSFPRAPALRLVQAALTAALLTGLAACGGGGSFSPPRDLDDACAIVAERPAYWRAMLATERKWGVPVAVQMATIHQESKFVGDARTPHRFALGVIPLGRQSSAYGYSQALDGTWEEYQRDQGRRSARRDRIEDATDFLGWYMDLNEKNLGISKSDARNQYLAYHEGRTGFARGSYNAKPWLIAVAARVAERAALYDSQLAACGRR